MESILFLAPTEADGTLSKAALETLGAATELSAALNAPLTVGLFGAEIQPAANSIAGCAVKFLGVAGADFAQSRYATDAAAAEALCRAANATIVAVPAGSRTARVMAGVAHRLGGRVDTHATAIALTDGAPTITRWYYRQRMEATQQRTQRPWVIVLDSGCHAAWTGGPPLSLPVLERQGGAAIESVSVNLPQVRTTVTGISAPKSDEQTIRPDAKLLFVTGAGWTKKQADGQTHAPEAETLILGFLRATQASLGGSKSVVDQSGEGVPVLSFITKLNQVGQTGATPRHPKGLSTCCHGEEPHVVGWRFINERRAVNLDPNCGWARGKADVLYVADAFKVMEKVNALLAEKAAAAGK
jgi:electron transfer flavoprotein alpha subunit